MRFSGEEMVFNRLKIRFKAMNVAEVNRKSITVSVMTTKVVFRGQSNLGT